MRKISDPRLLCVAAFAGLAGLAQAGTALATPCPITRYTSKTFGDLDKYHQLAWLTEMTHTEYAKAKALKKGHRDYSDIVAKSETIYEARRAADDVLKTLRVDNYDGYRRIWATDFLTSEELGRYSDCVTAREPGLFVVGTPQGDDKFTIVFSHLTPIGVEKVRTVALASKNIANLDALDRQLEALGYQDNFTNQQFTLELEDPSKPALLVMRSGWESPVFVFVPTYPAGEFVKAVATEKVLSDH